MPETARRTAPEDGKSEAAKDPRKSPLVVYSLQRIGRRDPHYDPIKPIGRSSFLVWILILAGAVGGGAFIHEIVNLAFVRDVIAPAVGDFFKSPKSRAAVVEGISSHPQAALIWGLTIGTAVSAGAALYYLTFYLVLVHVRDLLFDAARALAMASRRTARRIAKSASNAATRFKERRAEFASARGAPPRLG